MDFINLEFPYVFDFSSRREVYDAWVNRVMIPNSLEKDSFLFTNRKSCIIYANDKGFRLLENSGWLSPQYSSIYKSEQSAKNIELRDFEKNKHKFQYNPSVRALDI